MAGSKPKPRRRGFFDARRLVQLGFLVLIVVGVFVVRGNAERWCPFGGVETIYAYVTEGNTLCSVGVANLFILGALIVTLLLVRRAFCSHACPIGTVQEWVRAGARKIGIKGVSVPPRVDAALSGLKIGVVVLILFVTWQASELLFRTACPAYALLGRHGEDITYWAYVVSGAIVALAVFFTLPFCRYLCPLAVVMNLFSRFGLARIVRDTGSCIDCGKCSRACPMGIPVNEVAEVTHARCTSCLECVSSCPTRGRRTLAWTFPGAGRVRRALPQGVLIGVFLLVMGAGVAAAFLWPLPSFRWHRGAEPVQAAVVELEVGELSCRGRAQLFKYFLTRDDDLAIPGYIGIEAWPAPENGRARITYDPALTDADAVRSAITETYIDYTAGRERPSPFRIPGWDPLGIDLPPDGP